MRKKLLLLCCVMLCITGCGREKTENPFQVDTVVQIPVDPTEAPTESAATEDPGTEPTEEETSPPTEEPEETKASANNSGSTKTSSGKTSSGQTSSGKTSSGKTSSTQTNSNKSTQSGAQSGTEPKETKPEATEPQQTETPMTEPPETNQEVTELAETEPPVTDPPETEPPATEPPYDPSSYGIGGLEYGILEQINSYRTEAGLSELGINTRLSGIAALRAQEAAASWSHTRPDGRNFTSALSDYGYAYGSAAENLVYSSGGGDAAAMVAKWMSSDGHKANILGGFTAAGIGVYSAGGMTYVCCLFVG